MKIYNVAQIREWDRYTIDNEPISSLNLMERAAGRCFDWLMGNGYRSRAFSVFCGSGNNGGDGLVIARLLLESSHAVVVYVFETGKRGSDEYEQNLSRFRAINGEIRIIRSGSPVQIVGSEIIIDAIFGSGLNKIPEGVFAETIENINRTNADKISIDLPSGTFADKSSIRNTRINATFTLSFQAPKLAFMMSENEKSLGKTVILDIGLRPDYLPVTEYGTIDHNLASGIYQPRSAAGHKGTYGHSLIIAGSYGKIGAALLSTRACLRTGSGLVTAHVPACAYNIIQTGAPEAMTETDVEDKYITRLNASLSGYAAVGIGPGIGKQPETLEVLKEVIGKFGKPLVIDADALNLLSENQELLTRLPALSIITPHPKEFQRLFGSTLHEFERIELAKRKSREYNLIIVLKGHHSFVATPGGGWFNTTGNPGMATGGTGDALTGIITGLLAQKYQPADAARLGVYLHGLAGDLAADRLGQEALLASDLIENLGQAFLSFKS